MELGLSLVFGGDEPPLACTRSTRSLSLSAELGGSWRGPGRPRVQSLLGGCSWSTNREGRSGMRQPASSLPPRSFLVSPADPSILVMGMCSAGVEFKEQRQPCVILPCLPASPLPLVIPALNRDNYPAGFPGPGTFPFSLRLPPLRAVVCCFPLYPRALSAQVRALWTAVRWCWRVRAGDRTWAAIFSKGEMGI